VELVQLRLKLKESVDAHKADMTLFNNLKEENEVLAEKNKKLEHSLSRSMKATSSSNFIGQDAKEIEELKRDKNKYKRKCKKQKEDLKAWKFKQETEDPHIRSVLKTLIRVIEAMAEALWKMAESTDDMKSNRHLTMKTPTDRAPHFQQIIIDVADPSKSYLSILDRILQQELANRDSLILSAKDVGLQV
jgi:hypothetical protein